MNIHQRSSLDELHLTGVPVSLSTRDGRDAVWLVAFGVDISVGDDDKRALVQVLSSAVGDVANSLCLVSSLFTADKICFKIIIFSNIIKINSRSNAL